MSSVQAQSERQGLGSNAYLFLSFTMLCWAGNAVAGRIAVGEISPMLLTGLRWLTVVFLLALFARRQIAADWPVLRRHLGFTAAMGTLGFTAFNALFYLAAHSTTAVNLGILQGAIPVFVMLGAVLLLRFRVSWLQILGMAVTLVGVVTVATQGELNYLLELRFNPGDLLMLGAAALYAGYTLGLRKRPSVSFLGFFAGLAVAAFLSSIPLVAVELALGEERWPSLTGLAVTAYVAIFPSFLAQLSFMRGVQIIGPGRAGIFVNLVPVFAAILAVTILAEPFELFHLVALALVLGGIALAECGKGRH